jgi:hypothetical protein
MQCDMSEYTPGVTHVEERTTADILGVVKLVLGSIVTIEPRASLTNAPSVRSQRGAACKDHQEHPGTPPGVPGAPGAPTNTLEHPRSTQKHPGALEPV